MKKFGKMQIAAWILSVLPLLLTIGVFPSLPEKIPMHWDWNGDVSYGDKWQLLFVAVIPLGMSALFAILPMLDPLRRSYHKFRSGYELFQAAIMLMMLALVIICVIEAFYPGTCNVPMLICVLCSVLFIVIGNMMPKFRQNFFCGIRNPWTLSSEKIWTRTHRLGGRMMFGAGVIGLIGAFVPNNIVRLVSLFVPIMAACLIPTAFSYLWFRKEQKMSAPQ